MVLALAVAVSSSVLIPSLALSPMVGMGGFGRHTRARLSLGSARGLTYLLTGTQGVRGQVLDDHRMITYTGGARKRFSTISRYLD